MNCDFYQTSGLCCLLSKIGANGELISLYLYMNCVILYLYNYGTFIIMMKYESTLTISAIRIM